METIGSVQGLGHRGHLLVKPLNNQTKSYETLIKPNPIGYLDPAVQLRKRHRRRSLRWQSKPEVRCLKIRVPQTNSRPRLEPRRGQGKCCLNPKPSRACGEAATDVTEFRLFAGLAARNYYEYKTLSDQSTIFKALDGFQRALEGFDRGNIAGLQTIRTGFPA